MHTKQLAIGTLTTVFGGAFLATRGGGKKEGAKNTPPINASSKEEENFITYVLDGFTRRRLIC